MRAGEGRAGKNSPGVAASCDEPEAPLGAAEVRVRWRRTLDHCVVARPGHHVYRLARRDPAIRRRRLSGAIDDQFELGGRVVAGTPSASAGALEPQSRGKIDRCGAVVAHGDGHDARPAGVTKDRHGDPPAPRRTAAPDAMPASESENRATASRRRERHALRCPPEQTGDRQAVYPGIESFMAPKCMLEVRHAFEDL